MKAAFYWLADRWWLAILFVVAAVMVIFAGRDEGREILDAELEAIDAKRQAREMEARMGHERAIATINATHAATIKKIDADALAKATRLRSNPARYNAELAKLGRRLRARRRDRDG